MSSIGRIVRKNHAAVFWCTQHYPKAKREAVYTIYALIKHFDDLISSNLPIKDKEDIFKAWQKEISNIYDKKVPDTVIGRRIYKNCMRFKLPKESFETILKGFMMDCPNSICSPTTKEFEEYCKGVSEAPSYLILSIIAEFGKEVTEALSLNIGRAVEITNILKNIKEDALSGHIYIPKELLDKAGIEGNLSPKEILIHPNLHIARQALAEQARQCFNTAYELLKKAQNKNSKPIVFMLNHYHAYFELMDKRGWEVISPKPELKIIDNIRIICKSLFVHN